VRSTVLRRALAFAGVAMILSTTMTYAAVSTDQPDYSPGSVVTISGDNSDGAGYLPGETVDVVVSGPNGYAASCSAVADDAGAWSCQVTLWDSDLAVGAYSYTATGETSGVTETGSFTDAIDTQTTVVSSLNPSSSGQPVTFTATVKSKVGTPGSFTGTVTAGQVKFGTGNSCAGGFSELQAAQAVDSNGQVTFTTSTLIAGTTTIRACYLGSGSGSTALQTSDGTVDQVVNPVSNVAPSAPGKPSGTSPTQGGFTLNWTAATDDGLPNPPAALTYELQGHRAGGLFATVASGIATNSYTFGAGNPLEGTWTYQVRANDSALNGPYSPASDPIVVDRTAPTFGSCPAVGPFTYGQGGGSVSIGPISASDPSLPDGSSGSGVDAGSSTLSGSVSTTSVGLKTVTFTAIDNAGNSASKPCDYAVGKATLTVTADDQTITYGEADPSPFTFSYSGFVLGDGPSDVDTAPTCSTALPGPHSAAGSPYTISCTGGLDASYDFTYVDGSLVVNKATLTVTPDNQSVTYGDAAPGASFYTFEVSGFVLGEGKGSAAGYGDPSCTSDYTQGMHVADSPRPISCSGGSAADYTFSYGAAALTINPATLTVTPDNQSVTYGDAAPGASFYTFEVSGFVLGEDESSAVDYGDPSCTSDYTQGMHVADSTRVISCSGGSADDYTFSYGAAALTINKRELTPLFTVASKYFDGTTDATILTESAKGQYGSDVCTLAGGSTAFLSPAVVGPYDLELTGWGLSGANCGDYRISSDPVAHASIWAWDASGHGFYAPVGVPNSVFTPAPPENSPPTAPKGLPWNQAKGGSTIPLKFQVFAGSNELTDQSTPYPVKMFYATKMNSCDASTADAPDLVDFTTTGGTSLRYDWTAHQWIQNWKTPNVSADSCYRAWVLFADGSTLEAFFKLKK
jgi:hypothetical protein